MSKGIYDKQKSIQIEESSEKRVENIACNVLAEKLALILFGYGGKGTATKLIFEILREDISEILKEHENYCAERMSERLKSEFDLKSEINDGYALHAKLSSMIKELKDKK